MAGIVCHGGIWPITKAAIIVEPGISNNIPILTTVADNDLKVILNKVWPKIWASNVNNKI
mgnify:CR=1 FL=1